MSDLYDLSMDHNLVDYDYHLEQKQGGKADHHPRGDERDSNNDGTMLLHHHPDIGSGSGEDDHSTNHLTTSVATMTLTTMNRDDNGVSMIANMIANNPDPQACAEDDDENLKSVKHDLERLCSDAQTSLSELFHAMTSHYHASRKVQDMYDRVQAQEQAESDRLDRIEPVVNGVTSLTNSGPVRAVTADAVTLDPTSNATSIPSGHPLPRSMPRGCTVVRSILKPTNSP